METQTTNESNQHLKVLLVEDEKMVQIIHGTMLKKLGCQVEIAQNGEEALQKLDKNFHIVLMDIGLPDMRGSQVAIEMRRAEVGKRTPIVAITAYTGNEIDDECTSAGIDAIYNKPVTSDTMKKILAEFAYFDSKEE
jgi:CheY-like chemotaxis protein